MKVIAESNMGSSVYSTPVPANGALFIVNRNELFAIAADGLGNEQQVNARRCAARRSRPFCCRRSWLCACRRRRPRRLAPADRWAQFRGSPALSGHSDAKLPGALKVLWTYEAGDAIESSAAIVDGVVYVGSLTGELHAVNLADGKPKWKYKASADGIGESSPAVAGGSRLHRRSVRRAARRGRRHGQGGLDVQDRHARSSRRRSSPDDKVLIGSYDSHLYALGAKDGKLAWKVQTEGYVHATPAVVDGIAYIAGCDEILRGIRDLRRQRSVQAVVRRLHRRVAGDRRRPRLLRHLRERGARRRSQGAEDRLDATSTRSGTSRSIRRPRVTGDRVIVGGRDKMVHALDREDRQGARGRSRPGARVDSSPVVVGGRVYVGSNDGKLYVLDVATGKSVFEFEAGGPLSASPAVASGRLVIGSQDGKLFCLG